MTTGPELTDVEQPFLDQLARMGWKIITGSLDHPSVTGRDSFREVLIKPDLKAALRRINLRDGKEWLDDTRIAQAIGALERISHPRLMEANQEATKLLLEEEPTTVDGLPDWNQGRAQQIHFIDWENPENNTFTAISQFKVDCPGGLAKGSIRPDITLFVNGIPLVVVECKSPTTSEAMAQAVDQLITAKEQAYEILFNGYSVGAPPAKVSFLDLQQDGTIEAAFWGYDGVNASDIGERTLIVYGIEHGNLQPFAADIAAFALLDCNDDGRLELYYDPYRRYGTDASLNFGFYNRRLSTAWSLLAEIDLTGLRRDTALARAYASTLCVDVSGAPPRNLRPGTWPQVVHCELLRRVPGNQLAGEVESACALPGKAIADFCRYNRQRLLDMATTRLPFVIANPAPGEAKACLLPALE